jgi:hypothetical protein
VRLYRLKCRPTSSVEHKRTPDKVEPLPAQQHEHRLAYGIGLAHGLIGTGALLLSVFTQVKGQHRAYCTCLFSAKEDYTNAARMQDAIEKRSED